MSAIEFDCRMAWVNAALMWFDTETRKMTAYYNSGIARWLVHHEFELN